MKPQAIYWFRRDFRLADNPAICETQTYQDCLFVCEPVTKNSAQNQLLLEGVEDLNNELRKWNQKIHVLSGSLSDFLIEVRAVTSNPLVLLYTKSQNWLETQREISLEKLCQELKISTECFEPSRLFAPKNLSWSPETFPATFTSFKKHIEKYDLKPQEPTPAPKMLPQPSSLWQFLKKIPPYQRPSPVTSYFRGGPSSAKNRLHYYLWDSKKILQYKETRNGLLNFDDSSKLSPYLALGQISARLIYHELKNFEHHVQSNDSTYWLYFELLWREYFKLYAEAYGDALFSLTGPQKKSVQIHSDKNLFTRWCDGQTDEPFVNANMIELKTWSWMSNRGRQNVASYLAKTLKLDWRWGAQWFAQHLVDYDVESNWGNWAYLAGVGADPRGRVFNVQLQARNYDPHGTYTKKFAKA